jgi:isoleucyl-tRNA synthetase
MALYPESGQLNLPNVAEQILQKWKEEKTFEASISSRPDNKPFVFFEGPPSANGLPGIHHVMGRAIKDIFCRYKTLQGYQVKRTAGWDTHGLPVELSVEKKLGITKEDIGTKISVEDYNKECRETVLQYTDVWNNLTQKMGYWVDMETPYITYENKYIESVWWLLQNLYKKDMMYKGYTIQPYSPKAGTGLSSHEINQPGCYKNVKDTTVIAQFKALPNDLLPDNTYFLAWTTTPWTLPSNTALTVGKKIEYSVVKTFNQYTHLPVTLVAAKPRISSLFNGKYTAVENEADLVYAEGDKKIPFLVLEAYTGEQLLGLKFEQLLPYTLPMDDADKAFQIISGDFVTTEDGTGIVHTAPTFGADDAKVAKDAGVPPMLVADEQGNPVPLVDLQGRFTKHMGEFAGMYVKNEYYEDGKAPDKSADVLLAIKLKEENKAFKVEKYEHNYPHCWRTDKPILYYPLDSWFIKTTAAKDRLIELNKTINWKPKSTGTGRFGNWLENLNDWNLSRSRYWGIPIPIWRTEEGDESICIGSVEELKAACEKSVAAGVMTSHPLESFEVGNMDKANYNLFDLHKNEMDKIVLVSSTGKPMQREADLIDVWFDSGSMPYAQHHYPFENKDLIDNNKHFPADFIAEGVDQTRGWFFTLHAISTMCFDSVAYKNVVSNGLVLDKNGQKMSKRLGNAVEPFACMEKYGTDAIRWYMISNAQPWDNLKFDEEGITEVQRKFFRALHNTYAFYSLYANIDGFAYKEDDIPLNERPEIDRWILSKLSSLTKNVQEAFDAYEPTKAARDIQEFVVDNLSNWYVRLCRRRFWKGDYTTDKISAYQTLYTCLAEVCKLASPIAPFYADKLFNDLNSVTKKEEASSVHLTYFPAINTEAIDDDLEERMTLAQSICSAILSIRKKENIRVRQPLGKAMIPVLDNDMTRRIKAVESLILSEVNLKEIELVDDQSGVFVKKVKPNFKTLGPKYGKLMKGLAGAINKFTAEQLVELEQDNALDVTANNETVTISLEDVEISTDEIPGWLMASEGGVTVALDATITDDLKKEGIARELVNRIQNLRKDCGFEVTDKISILLEEKPLLLEAANANKDYICAETLADSLSFVERISNESLSPIEIEEGLSTKIELEKI